MANLEKTVLVTGAAGRIGGILRAVWGPKAALWQARAPRPGFVGWDMLAEDWQGPDLRGAVILHLAGSTSGPGVADTVPLAQAVLGLAARMGAGHVFLMSTAAVYGPGDGAALTEDRPPAPLSPYGAVKVAMEGLAQGLPGVTCLRLGNVAGADALLGGAVPGVPSRLDPVPGRPGGPERSYIGPQSLGHVLAGLCDLAGRGAALPPVINIAQPGSVLMADLLQAAGLPWHYGPKNPKVVPRVVLDTARLESLLPLAPADAGQMVAEWRALQEMMA